LNENENKTAQMKVEIYDDERKEKGVFRSTKRHYGLLWDEHKSFVAFLFMIFLSVHGISPRIRWRKK
jgi:exoribonuclease II